MNKNYSSSEESEQTEDLKLRELSLAICISPSDLLELQHNGEMLKQKIQEYNDLAVLKIQNEHYNEAIVYLDEAQRVISRLEAKSNQVPSFLKVCVMQNQVCVYQRLWEIKRAYSYMEKIINSMKKQLESHPNRPQNQKVLSSKNQKHFLKFQVARQTLMSIYYLQFSAISSQLKHNQVALSAVKEALEALRNVSQNCIKLETISSKYIHQNLSANMLTELADITDEISMEKSAIYLKEATENLAKLRRVNTRRKNITDKIVITFKDFTIGDVMQVFPITLLEMESRLNMKEQVSTLGHLYKAMYISICFFVVATENRLIAGSKGQNQAQKKDTEQYKMSELYHLKAINLVTKFIPCESQYLQHILMSFKRHYDFDLAESALGLIEEVSSIGVDSHNANINIKKQEFSQKNDKEIVIFSNQNDKVKNICSSRADKVKSLSKTRGRNHISTLKSNKKSSQIKKSTQKDHKLGTIPTMNTIKSTIHTYRVQKNQIKGQPFAIQKKSLGKLQKGNESKLKTKGKMKQVRKDASKSTKKSRSNSSQKSLRKTEQKKDKEKKRKKFEKMRQQYMMKGEVKKKKLKTSHWN